DGASARRRPRDHDGVRLARYPGRRGVNACAIGENAMPKTARGLNYVATDLRPPWRKSGLPVVFNHGIGTNLGIWSEWVPIVAAHHPVVRFDMRGFGQSPVPPAGHRWTFDEMIDDLLEVAATTGAEKVHVMGESIG